MFKTMLGALFMFILSLMLTTAVYASNLSLRVEVPKTPTNQNTFKINFVAMDISGGDIEVKCYKTGDATPLSIINLSAGSGWTTGDCEVTSTIVPTAGTYGFYVTATAAGSPMQTSPTVNVEYKTDAPSTPGNYNKVLLGSCQYKITFKTADDGGKTSRVEIYRSDQTSFTAEDSTRVGTVWIGSNMEGSFIDSVPDCGKAYYFVIRAFDGAGNGSGVAGDSVTKVTITSATSVTTTTQASPAPTSGGAIPVSSSQVSEGSILGEATPSSEEAKLSETTAPGNKLFTLKNIFLATLAIMILGGGYYYYRSRQK